MHSNWRAHVGEHNHGAVNAEEGKNVDIICSAFYESHSIE
jgi:hypothetical protein